MTRDRQLLIEIRADVRQAVNEMRRVRGEVARTGEAGPRAARGVSQLSTQIGHLARVAGAYLTLRLARSIVQQADAYAVLTRRIRTATDGFGDHIAVQRELEAISNRSGAAFRDTVDLFQRLSQSAPELGSTVDEMLQLTEVVQQLGVIGGSSPTAMSNALLQFGQSMSAGVVRAEELNSILENMPELAVRIARGMDMTVGELRRAVLEGRVLSLDVMGSLLGQADEIGAQFEDLPDTVGQAATAVGNAWQRALSELDKMLDGTSTLAKTLRDIERFLNDWSDQQNPDLLESQQVEGWLRDLRSQRESLVASLQDDSARLGASITRMANRRILAEIDKVDQSIAHIEAHLENVREREIDRGLLDDPDAPDSEPDPAETPDPEADKRREEIDKLVASLEDEAATLGMTAEALAQYRLAALGATEADQARAAAAVAAAEDGRRQQSVDEMIASLQDEAATINMTAGEVALYRLELLGASEAELALAENAVAAGEAVRQQQDDMERGREIIEATRTVQEQLNNEVAELVRLYEAGAFGAVGSFDAIETLRRATVEAFEALDEEGTGTMDRLTAAVRGWGDQFTETLANMVADGKLNFSDLADSIIRDILRIMIYQELTQPFLEGIGVLDPTGNAQGGPVGFAEGGQIRGPGSPTSDSILIRASTGEYVMRAAAVRHYGEGFMAQINDLKAPKFATGGLVGLAPVPGFAGGGPVTDAGAGAGNVEVAIDNRGTPSRVTDTEIDFRPDKMVVRVVLEDIERNGPIAQRMSGAFGVRRRG